MSFTSWRHWFDLRLSLRTTTSVLIELNLVVLDEFVMRHDIYDWRATQVYTERRIRWLQNDTWMSSRPIITEVSCLLSIDNGWRVILIIREGQIPFTSCSYWFKSYFWIETRRYMKRDELPCWWRKWISSHKCQTQFFRTITVLNYSIS